LTSGESSLLASIFYLGIFFGSIISGKLSDQYGRKKLILIGSTMQLIVSCSFFIANNLTVMTIIRFLYGFSFGFTIALTTSMFAESSPMKYRGKGLLLLNFCVSIGKIFGVALAYIFLDNFYEGNWKGMMIASSLPNFIVLYGALFIMD
jgi:MFS family permease